MDSTNLILGVSILVIILVAPIVVAFILERRHQARRPDCYSYGWGYYLGLNGLLVPLFWGLASDNVAGCLLVGAIIYYPIAILTLYRNRWGLLVLTVLSLNPIIWILNGFYISKRWDEMATKKHSPLPPPQIPQAKYFLSVDDQVKGPVSNEQIRALLSVGIITLDTQCCKEGTNEWHTLVGSGVLRDPGLSTKQQTSSVGTKKPKDRTILIFLIVMLIAPVSVLLSLLSPALVRTASKFEDPARIKVSTSATCSQQVQPCVPEHLVVNSDGKREPARGYNWLNPDDPKDLRVIPIASPTPYIAPESDLVATPVKNSAISSSDFSDLGAIPVATYFLRTKARAEMGDASAQYILGYCYEYGENTPIDLTKAFEWYLKAAAQGDTSAKKVLEVTSLDLEKKKMVTRNENRPFPKLREYYAWEKTPEGVYKQVRKAYYMDESICKNVVDVLNDISTTNPDTKGRNPIFTTDSTFESRPADTPPTPRLLEPSSFSN